MTAKSHSGFTLIEILVALAIGALLLSGIVQVFTSLKQTDRVAMALSRVQEAGRTAMDTLAYDLRMTGYKGCSDPTITENVNIIALNAPTNDFISDSLRGFDVTATNWSSGTELSDIDGTAAGDARLNSDVVSIMRASELSSELNEHDNNNSNVKVLGNPLELSKDDIAILSDCDSMDIFAITNVTGSGITTFAHGVGTTNASNKLSKAYTDDNARLLAFVSNTYFVSDTGRKNVAGDTIHALYKRDVNGVVSEVVEGVENLQITYGEEFINGNRRFVAAGTAGLNMAQVTSIKFSVLVSSNDRVLESNDSTVYQMAGTNIGPASGSTSIKYENDRRLRKVFSMTVNLRNRRVSI